MASKSAEPPTLTELVFAELRPHFAAVFRVAEASVRPDVPLWWLMPQGVERRAWNELAERCGATLPRLQPPARVARAGWWLAVGSAVRLVVAGLWLGCGWLCVPLGAGGFAVSLWLLERLSRPFATELDPEIKTVGDLASWILARNLKRYRRQFGVQPNRDEIFATVKLILVEQLGVPPEKVTWEASFVNDLGLC